MRKIIKGITTLLFIVCLSIMSGCGDDEGLPFWVKVSNSTIDLSNPNDAGVSLVTATIFDSKGNPMKGGKMSFGLSNNAGGYFVNDEDEKVKAVSIDIDDGVAEVMFHSNRISERVVVTAYCPGYPNDAYVSATINVINGETFWVDTSKSTIDLTKTTDDGTSLVTAYIFDSTTGLPLNSGTMTFTLSPGAMGYFLDGAVQVKTLDVDIAEGVAGITFYAKNVTETVTVTAACPASGYASENTTINVIKFLNTVDFTATVKVTGAVYVVTFTDTSKSGPTDGDVITGWDWIVYDAAHAELQNYSLTNGNPIILDMSTQKDTVCSADLTVHRQDGSTQTNTEFFLVK